MRGKRDKGTTTKHILYSALLTFAVGSVTAPTEATAVKDGQISAEDLYIVDCLLPGQVRQLGGNFTFVAPRRAVRTSARDCAIRGGEYVAYDRANYQTALKVWLPAAKEGDADAQTHVGEIYEKGLGTTPNHKKAAQWYELAAAQGQSRAQLNLGHLFEQGIGVEQDQTRAMNLYRQAAGIEEGVLEVTTADERLFRDHQARENEQLRARVTNLGDQLRATQEALDRRKTEVDEAQKKLDKSRIQLKQQQGASVEQQRKAQTQLARLERDIERKKAEVLRYQNTAQSLLGQLGLDPQIAHSVSDPKISIISPEIMVTRGVPNATVLSEVTEYDVVGRVTAEGALRSFRVNDLDALDYLSSNGVFQYPLDILEEEVPVTVEAITEEGKRATKEFLVSRQPPAEVSARNTGSLLRKRLNTELGQFHALVIGNNTYRHHLPLTTAVNDATAVANVLKEQYGYRTTLLLNATLDQIVGQLADYAQNLTRNDNLVVYYAGHGVVDGGRGYWLPVDAHGTEKSQWLGNERITDFISEMAAKHVLVVADSCYSGTLSGTTIRPIPLNVKDQDLLYISRVKARTVLTSGGLEPVIDNDGNGQHSVFAKAFLSTLRNNQNLMEGYRLFLDVSQQVRRNARLMRQRQIPEYTALKHAGHEGSEFFFLAG